MSHRLLLVHCSALGLAMSLAACSKERSAVRWSPALALSSRGGGAAPVLATSADGRATALWVDAPANGTDGRLMVRPDARTSTDVEVRDPEGSLTIYGETPPKAAYGPTGTLYAAYLITKAVPGHKWPTNSLRFITSEDHGAHWSAPVTVQSDTAHGGSTDDHALFVASDGTIYLSWLALTGDTSHTYVTHSSDGGVSWSPPSVVDSRPSCPCCRTALTSGPDGTLFVAWRKIYGTSPADEVRDIVVASSEDHGATWSAPVRVHEDEWHVNYCPDAGPTVKVGRDGIVHVAWWTGKQGAAGVRYTQSRDGGHSFAAPIPLGVAQDSRAAHAQLALGDSGVVAVAWDDGTRAVPPIVLRVSRDGGRTFGPADTVSATGQTAGYPGVAIVRDTLFVAWQQRSVAAVAADSTRQLRRADSLAHVAHAAESAPWIQPVGSWAVLMRIGATR